MNLSVFALVCLLGTFATSNAKFVPIEKLRLDAAPHGWMQTTRAASTDELQLTIAVKQQNLGQFGSLCDWPICLLNDACFVGILEKTLLRISDPDSSDYGKHLSFEQV